MNLLVVIILKGTSIQVLDSFHFISAELTMGQYTLIQTHVTHHDFDP